MRELSELVKAAQSGDSEAVHSASCQRCKLCPLTGDLVGLLVQVALSETNRRTPRAQTPGSELPGAGRCSGQGAGDRGGQSQEKARDAPANYRGVVRSEEHRLHGYMPSPPKGAINLAPTPPRSLA